MKRIAVFGVVIALASSLRAADPTVEQILDKYVAALGGKGAIEKLTSRVSKGTLEIAAFNVGGTIEINEKAPNRFSSHSKIEGFGEVKQVFNGKSAWMSNPMSGVLELSGAGLEQARRAAEFHRQIKMKSLFAQLSLKGKEKVGDREAFVIEATPAAGGGGPEKFYFDAENGLLARLDTEREVGADRVTLQMYYEDYRAVDGVKVAHLVKQVRGDFTVVSKLTEVKHNVAIDDARFAKPTQ